MRTAGAVIVFYAETALTGRLPARRNARLLDGLAEDHRLVVVGPERESASEPPTGDHGEPEGRIEASAKSWIVR